MGINYRSITVEIRSIPAVTLQQATPSPWCYHKFHLQTMYSLSLKWYTLSDRPFCDHLSCNVVD